MRIDELRDTLAEMAAEQPATGAGAAAVVARGRRRLFRRRISVAALVLAVVGAGAGFAATRHDARRGVEVGPTPTPSTTPSTSAPATARPTNHADGNGALFTSSTEGWICANPLLHTADGGHTWQSGSYGTVASDTHTCAAVPTDAWILAQATDGRLTLLPAQGGPNPAVSSTLPTLPAGAVVQQLTFVDKNDGWFLAIGDHGAADHGLLYRTTTGSGRMQFTLVSSNAPARGVQFANARDGWGISDSGVSRTADAGSTWHAVAVPMPQPIAAELGLILDHITVHGSTIVVQGENPSGNLSGAFFIVSDDGGATWEERGGPPASFGTAEPTMLAVPDATHWRFAFGNELWVTDDGGSSWTKRTMPDVESIAFPTADVAWATGTQGDVLQTADAGRTWHVVDTTPQPVWSSVIAVVPTGCPDRTVTQPPAGENREREALQAAEDFVLRTRGWTGEEVQAVYPVRQPGGEFGVVFSTNVPKFCGAAVAALSYGVELHNPSITQDTSRNTALVVGHFADGWKVWGFYK
jgi:photosystem II stability/assembly factor-like uncharacterized protein